MVEGDPDSPSATRPGARRLVQQQLVTNPTRVTTVRYRRPGGAAWEDLDLDTAVDTIADRVIKTRKRPGRSRWT